MAHVAKTAGGTKTGNTVVLRTVKIFFQIYPGLPGTDAERAIAGIPYRVTVADHGINATGTSAADGSVDLQIPAGSTARLTALGTVYPISVRRTLEAHTTVHGAQRRLSQQGYDLGAIDGIAGKKTDNATMNFQADNSQNADGVIATITETQLVMGFGE